MAELFEAPSGMRLKIAFFGRTNSGKSSVINALFGQKISLVSDVKGTTTDPVNKAMEIYPLGPCLLTDTAGFSDNTELGKKREERTKEVLLKTDLAVMVFATGDTDFSEEKRWLELLKENNTPFVCILNKADLGNNEKTAELIKNETGESVIFVSAAEYKGIDELREALVKKAPKDFELPSICGHLVKKGDSVLLVAPQQINAPKGRLILPQVQVIRDLLDIGAVVTVAKTEEMKEALLKLKKAPDLIITDSQEFKLVYENKPEMSRLTSFSALLARFKGDIDAFVNGAETIFNLKETDKVLIAEACAHAPLEEDIGRVKIPKMLKKIVGEGITVDVVSGNDFPEDLSRYSLIIHCGGCMFGRKQILSRIAKAKNNNVPITNYGIFIAKVNGILDKIVV